METIGDVGYLGIIDYIHTDINGISKKRTTTVGRTSRGGFLCPYKTLKTALKNTKEQAKGTANHTWNGTCVVLRARVVDVQFHIIVEQEVNP